MDSALPRQIAVEGRREARFAFVAGNRNRRRFRHDPSYVYRCENLAAGIVTAGPLEVSLLHRNAALTARPVDVAVFHRPNWSVRHWLAKNWLGRRNGVLVADVDDLIFDEDLAPFSPGVLNGSVGLAETQRQFAANRRALERFDLIIVSTVPLAEHVRRCFPWARVGLVSNAVHRSWREVSPRGAAPDGFVVSYLPGTRSHDRDFGVYCDGVEAFLAKYPDARLEVTGPLNFALAARPGQIAHRERVPFEHYHERVSSSWVNLAPLEPTPFTRCKSALKVLEAGYWGIPTVCSPIPDAERFRDAGALFAADGESCFKWLEAMMESDRYRRVTENLSERVLALADVDREAQKFLGFVGISAEGA